MRRANPAVRDKSDMRLTLDVARMRDCMALWRDTLTLRPLQNDPATRAERAKLLASVDATFAGWLDLLLLCTVDDADLAQMEKITCEVTQCRAWVAQAAQALRLMDDIPRI